MEPADEHSAAVRVSPINAKSEIFGSTMPPTGPVESTRGGDDLERDVIRNLRSHSERPDAR
jgi:hypothetical protein